MSVATEAAPRPHAAMTAGPHPHRAAALLLSVSHLVLVARSACPQPGDRDWVDRSLAAAEQHMAALRHAAMAAEPERTAGTEPFRQEQSAI